VPVVCGAETNFLPTRAQLEPHLAGARLVALCSPLNPAGTLFDPEQLAGICDAILEENARRGPGERPLYLLYDHIYWMLTFGAARHVTPPGLRPAMARYTIFVDGISKAFAATGVRVGWSAGPPDVIERMSGLLGHVGAWAPRPEQVAVAKLLDDDAAMDDYHATMKPGVEERLTALYRGLAALAEAGLPVRAVPPRAAIYLTAEFDLVGATTADGRTLAGGEDIRRWLLAEAGMAIVPFSAFGASDASGWFRLSVGAVSVAEIAAALPRLEAALRSLPAHAAAGAPPRAGS
jgi:aspartate aminotransferase